VLQDEYIKSDFAANKQALSSPRNLMAGWPKLARQALR